jgi:hypothetical protein
MLATQLMSFMASTCIGAIRNATLLRSCHCFFALTSTYHHILARLLYDELAGPRAPFGVPVRKPFFARRATCFNVLMRPVPVVFLLLAFSLQFPVSSC